MTPLWNGVTLCRDLSLGHPSLGSASVHLLVLLVWAVVGFLVAARVFERRLVS